MTFPINKAAHWSARFLNNSVGERSVQNPEGNQRVLSVIKRTERRDNQYYEIYFGGVLIIFYSIFAYFFCYEHN